MILSLIIASLLWKYQKYILDQEEFRKPIAALLIICSVFVAVYARILNGNGTIETKYAMDCCKASGAGLGFAIGWYLEQTRLYFSTYCHSLHAQILKLLIGLAGALLLRKGLPFLLGTSILAKAAEYFILVLWVLIIYPYLFSKRLRRE